MLRNLFAIALVAVMVSPSLCWAQPNRNRMNASSLPRVGSYLPEVNVVDERGNPFSTESLFSDDSKAESYTVLVFGCLT